MAILNFITSKIVKEFNFSDQPRPNFSWQQVILGSEKYGSQKQRNTKDKIQEIQLYKRNISTIQNISTNKLL